MRFRDKSSSEDEPERCPRCHEVIAMDAVECSMCGATLKQIGTVPADEEAGAQAADGDDR